MRNAREMLSLNIKTVQSRSRYAEGVYQDITLRERPFTLEAPLR